MTSPNPIESSSKISLDAPDSQNNPFIWGNIALLAAVPWLLGLSMAGLAVGDPLFPAWFEILLLGAPAIAVVTWLQWQQPFFPFSLWFLAKPADSLSERERQVLSLLKQSRNGWYTTGWIATVMALVMGVIFCRIYLSAPLAQSIAPLPMGLRLFGIVWAEIFFLLSNVLLQAGISALRVKLTPESEVESLSPFAVEKVKNSFTSIGWQSPQLLKFFENDQIEEQVVSNDSPQVEESAQPEVMQPEVIDEQQDAQDAGESEETVADSSEPAEVIAEIESSDLEVNAEVYEEVSEIAIADLHTEELNEEVNEIAIAEFAEVDQVAEETEQIIEVSSDLVDQTDAIEEILVSELAEVEPEQLVTASEPEELEPIPELELSPEPNEIITDVVSDRTEIEEIQDLDTTQVFTEAEHLEAVVDHPEVEAEPIEAAAEIIEEVVTETQELGTIHDSEKLDDAEPIAENVEEEEFVETAQAIAEFTEEVVVASEDAERIAENVDEEVTAAIEDTERIAENINEEVTITVENTEAIAESVDIAEPMTEDIDQEVSAVIEDAESTTENVDEVLETESKQEAVEPTLEAIDQPIENIADEPIVDEIEISEIAEIVEETAMEEAQQEQIDTAVENALMDFDVNVTAKENKKTLGFAKKTRKSGNNQKKKGFGKSSKPSDDDKVNAPETIAIVEETAIAEPAINEVEQSNDSDHADNLATPTEEPAEEIAETQKKSPKYLVEEFLVDKFLARLEELNNPDKDNKNTQVDNSEPANTEPSTQNNDEFADLEALIDRKSSPEDSE